ncbi:MAG: hypothetical protein KGH61_04865 [Candidatus Micrarchaeota archaeon]|nr:hypothetical protein [Candidatus Micrarchaeota archaeon]MDE1848249.1 hypothetical protein [Candidatus Micrarchaeota archaeon]MDE1864897.1 hypothetical protein [Candidatus Micrarchaeota archaeon]
MSENIGTKVKTPDLRTNKELEKMLGNKLMYLMTPGQRAYLRQATVDKLMFYAIHYQNDKEWQNRRNAQLCEKEIAIVAHSQIGTEGYPTANSRLDSAVIEELRPKGEEDYSRFL